MRVLLVFLFLLPIPAAAATESAEECWKLFVGEFSEERSEADLRIVPFHAEDKREAGIDAALTLTVLLGDYLESAGVETTTIGKARWRIEGDIQKTKTAGSWVVASRFWDEKSGKEVGRFESLMVFPGASNEVLMALMAEMSRSLKGIRIKEKRVVPYLHRTGSGNSLILFARGSELLDRWERNAAPEAIRYFEKAIAGDYNYVPGYLGLAEALAQAALSQEIDGIPAEAVRLRARSELAKAKLLLPPMAELREDRIEKILKADPKKRCHG